MRSIIRALIGVSLFSLFLTGCQSTPEVASSPSEPVHLGQQVDLVFMGLTLDVPDTWDVYRQVQTRHLPNLAHVFLADGYTDSTQFRAGRTDAINLTMMRCSDQASRTQHLHGKTGGLRRIFERDGRIVRELRPGDPAFPFSWGTGFEAVIEHHEDSTWTTRAYGFFFAHDERCYAMTIENLDLPFQRRRTTYAAIVRSIAFQQTPSTAETRF